MTQAKVRSPTGCKRVQHTYIHMLFSSLPIGAFHASGRLHQVLRLLLT